ncbi:HlyD family secretion protein [Thiomicrorhabdus cannonii]|uniref:HlyD family secretion protein n=1 Tax=Thiomicrorhabdus cannonii TaxID=2748011 RepID=UPI0015C198C9|nr:HlyD family efflux transporter periplasmic adaptor subunit [Thiomicrorhabdus cannonii]
MRMNWFAAFLIPFWLTALLTGCSKHENGTTLGELAWDRVELINEASESIVERSIAEGSRVSTGEVILKLDDRRAQADLAQAQANRQQLAARLDELQHGPRPEEIEQAKQAVLRSQSQLNLAQLELNRLQKLLAQKLISQNDLDRAKNDYQTALAEFNANQANLTLLQSGTRSEQLEQAKQALDAANEQVSHLQINLERHQIRAPVDGILDSLPFQLGEQPAPHSVVAVLLSGKQPYARVHVPEQIRAFIKPGTPAEVQIDGVANVMRAKVRSIQSDPDFTPYYALTEGDRSRLSYTAKLDIEADLHDLPAGLPLTVVFDLDKVQTTDAGAAR